MTERGHRYFAAWPHSVAKLLEIPNAKWDPSLPADWRYALAVLSEASKEIEDEGLYFYFTKDPYRLPEYGPHVVAVLLLEERCKIPSYARHIRAVIRNTRSVPFLGLRPRAGLSRLEFNLAFEYVRDWAMHLKSRLSLSLRRPHWPPAVDNKPHIYTIPLGYHSQEDLPQIPMRDRSLDCFFAGDLSVGAGRNSYRYWISTSKVQARKQLWRVLDRLKSDPEWHIELGSVTGQTVNDSQFNSYSQKMMNSRICVAPRGSMAETYRFYEGLRAGCLVISNRLGDESYLKGAPVIQVDHWKELPCLFKKYARNLAALEHYRAASLAWWEQHCSERVFGPRVAHFLNEACPDKPQHSA